MPILEGSVRLYGRELVIGKLIKAVFEAKDRIEYYSEFLDVARFPGEEQQKRQRDFFRDKYRTRPPNLVIAVSGGALSFLTEHRDEVLYLTMFQDAAGKTFTPRQALDLFAQTSRAPIYGCYDT